jgi:hypothetical protein
MNMTEDQRHTIETFKAGVSLTKTGADGFPIPHEFLGLELQVLGRLVLKVDTILLGRPDVRLDDLNAEERSLLALTDATSRLIAAMESGDRDPAIPEAWFKARAALVEPYE